MKKLMKQQQPISVKSTKKSKQAAQYNQSLILKDLVSDKNNKNKKCSGVENADAHISNYGHYICLFDGFNSDTKNRLEIAFPSLADLSISQKNGFTVFFWMLVRKTSDGVHRYIIKKGNLNEELAPGIGILPNGTNLFIKINTSKGRTESLFSSRSIETEKLYNITVTFSVDYNNDLTDIALYIDGLVDSQTTLPGEPVHNQGDLLIGKPDNISYGFKGWIGDVIFIPKVLKDEDILQIGNSCLDNLSQCGSLKSYYVIEHKLEYDILVEKYAQVSGVPINIVMNMNIMNQELREILKRYNIQLEDKVEETHTQLTEEKIKTENLKSFIGRETSLLCISIKNLYTYAQFIYTIIHLCASAEEIEVTRIIHILSILESSIHVKLSEEDLICLAKLLDSYMKEGNLIKFELFFKTLRSRVASIFPDLSIAVYQDKESNQQQIELHENLLLSSQNFKYVDDSFKELGKMNFSIRSLYNRGKSGKSQSLSNIGNTHDNFSRDKEDMVNHYGSNDEFVEKINEENEENIEKSGASYENFDKSEKVETGDNDARKETDKNIKEEKKEEDNDEYNDNFDDKEKSEVVKNEDRLKKEDSDVKERKNNEEKNEDAVVQEQKKNSVKSKEETNTNNTKQSDSKLEDKNPEINNNKFINEDLESSEQIINNRSNNDFSTTKKQTKFNMEQSSIKEEDNNINFINNDNNNDIHVNNNYTNEESNVKTNKKDELEPKYPEDWHIGDFQIVINHCYDCHTHKTTTKHCEYQFVDKFNEIFDQITLTFPNAKVLGNYEELEYYGQFDVYLRGVGPKKDDSFRYYIFKLKEMRRFPSSTDITDALVALSMLYGSSINLAISQQSFFKEYGTIFKPSKIMHEGMIDVSPEAEEHKKEKELMDQIREEKKNKKPDPEKTKYACNNYGCERGIFTKADNHDKACTYHPGVFQFGSYHAYWPEAWSCCERKWEEPGCTVGPHRPEKLDRKAFLCVNHGEVNPNTGRPDYACGVYYLESDNSGCNIHPGYKTKGRFTCCGREGGSGCQEGNHTSAIWPDERAKLAFYPKILNNPGLIIHDKKKKPTNDNIIGHQICQSGLFKAIKPYPDPRTKLELLRIKREKEKVEPKYCLNWACGKLFKDTEDENKPGVCRCHPGKYDHGATGIKMSNYMYEIGLPWKERKSVLWEPQWTCCRKSWESPGCKLMRHRGIFTEELESSKIRPYTWPDIRAKLYFKKIVTDKWKANIQQYIYSPNYIKKILNSSSWSKSSLPELCDKLKLYFILIDEKPDYHMKFNDVVASNNSIYYFLDKSENINKEKFLKWWFMDYEEIMEEMMPKEKKEEKKEEKVEENVKQ